MESAYSRASRATWAKVPPQERSKRMSELARRKQRLLTPKQRRAHSLKMVAARKKK